MRVVTEADAAEIDESSRNPGVCPASYCKIRNTPPKVFEARESSAAQNPMFFGVDFPDAAVPTP